MITLVCGKPGVGKSTFLALEAKKAIKKGLKVYSNFHILGTHKLDMKTLGTYHYENCLIIIDEAQLYYNNRSFASFKSELADFLCLHRHYSTDIIFSSQDFMDVDIKIRRLAQRILLIQPTIFFWTIKVQRVSITLGMNQDKTEIVTTYETSALRTRYLRKRPAWKYFDSFERKQLVPILIEQSWGELPITGLLPSLRKVYLMVKGIIKFPFLSKLSKLTYPIRKVIKKNEVSG